VTMGGQAGVQILGVVAVCAWSAIGSLLIGLACRATIGLRVSQDALQEGLDVSAHGERAYSA